MAPRPAKIPVSIAVPKPAIDPSTPASAFRARILREIAARVGWCVLILMPATIVSVAMKWSVVVGSELQRLAAMMFRMEGTITFQEKLTFVRSDLLMGLLILPLVLALATWVLPKTLRFALVAMIGGAALTVE